MTRLPYASPEDIGLDSRRFERACDLLEAWTRDDAAPLPAAALCVGRNGKAVEPRLFGRMGAEHDAPPIRRDTIFLLASITKPITYTAAMLLVERGQLCLTDRVTEYIPDFAAHHKEETLVLHLFTHTSGLPDMLGDDTDLRRGHAPLSRFIEGACRDTVPLFPAGTSVSYQSMGTLVVAEIVQRLSGKPIARFIADELLQPLGLSDTSLGSGNLPAERLVPVMARAERADPSFGWNSPYWRQLGAPWGGMFSTTDDFAVICQLLLSGGEYHGVRWLAPETVRRMTTNRLNDLPELPEHMRRTQPWGLGWRLNHPGMRGSWGDLLSERAFGHTGATGTMLWVDPAREGFCIIFTSAPNAGAAGRMPKLSNTVAAAFI